MMIIRIIRLINLNQVWLIVLTVKLFSTVQCQPNSSVIVTLDRLKSNTISRRLDQIQQPGLGHPQQTDNCKDGQLYPADIFAKIENLNYYEDCLIICCNTKLCQSITYIKSSKSCYLKTSELHSETFDSYFEGLSSKQCNVYDIKREKVAKTPTQLDHGSAPTGCGLPAFPFVINKRPKRIIDGGQPTFYSLPWMVSLREWKESYNKRFCGGSIIVPKNTITATSSSRFVLTAAHCVWNEEPLRPRGPRKLPHKQLYVHAGSFDVRFAEAHRQRSYIEAAYVHPEFDFTNKDKGYDLAVLYLNEPFKFNDYVRPICLPTSDEDHLSAANSHEHYIAGWGAIEETKPLSEPKRSVYLKAAEVTLVKHSLNKLGNMFFIKAKKNSETGGNDNDGDSGGPIFSMDSSNNGYTVWGVCSVGIYLKKGFFSKLLSKTTKYGQFTHVSFYRDWIDQIMESAPKVPNNYFKPPVPRL